MINNKTLSVTYNNGGYNGYYFLEDSGGFSFGIHDGHWIIFNLYYPLVEGAVVPYIGPNEYGISNPKITIESTTATVTVKAGTFKNVVIFK